MKRLLTTILLYLLFSTASAKLYIHELNPSSGDEQDVRVYSDVLDLLRSFESIQENERSVSKSSDESKQTEEIPIAWDSDIPKMLRGRDNNMNCYNRKHLSMICANTCVGAMEYGCRVSGCEDKHKMKEFCNLPCKLAYNMYT